MVEIEGKTVVVTGASRGIGEATARLFAAQGAKVALLARSSDDITRIAGEIGPMARAYPCDIADWDALSAALAAAERELGSIDILINNAALLEPIAHLSVADPADWSRLIDVNIKGVFYAMRLVVPKMVVRGGGTVLTVSSGAAHGPVEGWSAYCTSKAGAAMLTAMLDHEERQNGIRAMGLSPGTVATQMQRDIKASGMNPVSQLEWSDHIPPEWPAQALLWMCGSEADPFIGQEIKLRDEDIRRRVGLTA